MIEVEAERLRGEVRLRSGGLAPAYLVRDGDGLWLRDHSNPEHEVNVAVLDARPLGYLEGTFGDELQIGEKRYGVPTGRGDAIKGLFARARLPEPGDDVIAPPEEERFIEKRSANEERWLRGWLAPDEPLLAWLRLGQRSAVESKIGPTAQVRGALVVTPTRAALIAVGPFGDTKHRPLDRAAMKVGRGLKRPVMIGEHQLATGSGNGERFATFADAFDRAPADRALAVARALRADDVPDARRVRLLEVAAAEHPTAAVLAALYADADAPPDALRGLLEGDDPKAALFGIWDTWPIGSARGARLVAWGRELAVEGAKEAVLGLHDHVHKARLASAGGGFAPAAIDLDYADHLIADGAHEDAVALLEARLARLPSEELADLVPSEEAEAEDVGHGAQVMRIAVLDRLADARGNGDGRHGPTVAELARLMPLTRERLAELAQVDDGEIGARVRTYRDAIAGRRWTEPAPVPESLEVGALDKETIEQVLRHPLSRRGHALGALSGLLAEVEVPDESALRAYCERLGSTREDAHDSLTAAMTALSVEKCTVYVSRGDKSVGLRSYEGDDPFLLVGAEHLDERSPRYLGPAEMRFALGAELAHLRFGHSRVTSTDIWVGALSKSKKSFDTVAGLLPAWRLLKVAEKASTLASYYQDGTVEWALKRLGRLTGWDPFGTPEADKRLGADPEDLIAAARVMQLTADRTGLLLCGDLHAAVRAVCLTHEGYASVLEDADERTMASVLAERDDEGKPVRQTLAIRTAAMIAFHLSEEWDALRAELLSRTGELSRTDH